MNYPLSSPFDLYLDREGFCWALLLLSGNFWFPFCFFLSPNIQYMINCWVPKQLQWVAQRHLFRSGLHVTNRQDSQPAEPIWKRTLGYSWHYFIIIYIKNGKRRTTHFARYFILCLITNKSWLTSPHFPNAHRLPLYNCRSRQRIFLLEVLKTPPVLLCPPRPRHWCALNRESQLKPRRVCRGLKTMEHSPYMTVANPSSAAEYNWIQNKCISMGFQNYTVEYINPFVRSRKYAYFL